MSKGMKDIILHLPVWLTSGNAAIKPPAKVTVVYFITGNPGLIGYYEEFLGLLATGRKGRECIIAGASLGSFESRVEPSPTATTSDDRLCGGFLWPKEFKRKDIYDLRDQIELSYGRLVTLIEELGTQFDTIEDTSIRVILAGHSVGAYIALEIVRLQHEAGASKTAPSGPSNSIAATLLLTPTIHNISHSSSGRIATPVLGYLPIFPSLLQFGTSGLTATLPASWLRGVVTRVTGMKSSNAIDTTVGFLQTPGAVKQALYMAGCEMQEIGENKWTEEVWGAADAAKPATKTTRGKGWQVPEHYFLFAKDDHWVADVTRDAIVKSMRGRATVLVDQDRKLGLVHAWCLQQSDMVAGIVNGWLDEILVDGD